MRLLLYQCMALVFMALFTLESMAQLKPAKIFSNGMVLQRGVNIPVWGTTTANQEVKLTLNGITISGTANAEGQWEVKLPAMEAGGPFKMTLSSAGQELNYTEVYIGDVWLASGQSNMALTLSESTGGAAEVSAANNQLIRQFKVPTTMVAEISNEIPSGSAWTPATPDYAGAFSSVGYYFAKDLQSHLGIPVGIINTSQGGARIEAWMSEQMLGFDEKFVKLANGETERQATMCYNQMLNPLIRFPIKGFIWYQGESNADNLEDALAYGSQFKDIILAWRKLWNLGDIPFLWVQLPNQGTAAVESAPGTWDAWPQLRSCQSRCLSIPNTGEVCTMDVGEVDIHPKDKVPVGKRLALVARKVAYGADLIYSGPRYKSHTILPNGRVEISFDNIGSGLIAKDNNTGSLKWFSLAGSDGQLLQAQAKIEGNKVIVWNDNLPNPTILRYAWEYNPQNINFFNAEGLPAFPFMINLIFPGFGITSFKTNNTTIERGGNVLLTWQANGASVITLNGTQVDSVSAIMVRPVKSTTYILEIMNKQDANITKTASVTVEVIDPKPTITLSSNIGDVVAPGTEITIQADANAPGGETVKEVKFFVDGELLTALNKAPYKTLWTPGKIGEYTITGQVTNSKGVSVESKPLIIYVTKLKMLIFEAESAKLTGNGKVVSNSKVSGGKYMDLTDGWTLTFTGIDVPEKGEYPLFISYLMNYDPHKMQNLIVNGTAFGAIDFTAPDTKTWMKTMVKVPLNAENNEITIQGSWNWMSFDYIAIAIEDTTTEKPVSVQGISNQLQGKWLNKNYPNPANASTTLSYSIPKSGQLSVYIYNTTGAIVDTLLNGKQQAGAHTVLLKTNKLKAGTYFAKLIYNGQTDVCKINIVH